MPEQPNPEKHLRDALTEVLQKQKCYNELYIQAIVEATVANMVERIRKDFNDRFTSPGNSN